MRASKERGYTLVELTIVVSILALITAIVIPAATSSNADKDLELVAAEFASAIRFARSESIRTGEPHGFRFFTTQYRIRVFRADTSASPWTWIWDVYHPIEKQLYDITFPADLAGAGVPVTQAPVYRGTCNQPDAAYFDDHGTPWCLEPETVLLETYRLDMVVGAKQATVVLDGITGRVTVQ